MSKKKIKQIVPTNNSLDISNVSTLNQEKADVLRRISENRIFFYVCVVIFAIVTVYYYPYIAVDYDIWYHLKFGEHFVTNKTFQLDHSIFSWTPADPDWKYGIWLGSSALYLIYSFAGVYGLELMKWLIILSILLLYFYYSYKVEGKIDISNILVASLLIIPLNAIASMIKPDNFTLLFFSVIVFIYFHAKIFSSRFFYVYPLIFFLWVNTHGGFLVGLFFITIIFFGELLNLIFKRRDAFTNRIGIEFALVVFFSYIVTLLNPYGVDYHLYIIPSYFKSEIMSYAGKVFAFESLWKHIFSDYIRLRNALWGIIILFTVFLCLSVYLYKRKQLIDIGLLFSNILFFYLGTTTSRVVVFSAVLLVFTIAYLISRAGAAYIKAHIAVFSMVCFFLCASLLFYDASTKTEYRSWVVMEDVLPDKEVEYVKKYMLPHPIFNDYLIGGYLIWSLYPEYKVFIDPRYGPYWKQVGPDYFNLLTDTNTDKLKAFNNKYPFKTAIIHYAEAILIKLFMRSDNWRLVYFGDSAAVFVRKDVFDEISKEALFVDISPDRFKNLRNPITFNVLFTIYANLGFIKYAEKIIDLYSINISPFYAYKENDMEEMHKFLNRVRVNPRQQ